MAVQPEGNDEDLRSVTGALETPFSESPRIGTGAIGKDECAHPGWKPSPEGMRCRVCNIRIDEMHR